MTNVKTFGKFKSEQWCQYCLPLKIMENAEINNIIKIIGLQYKKNYSDPDSLKTLRYGKIMIMTDQVWFLVSHDTFDISFYSLVNFLVCLLLLFCFFYWTLLHSCVRIRIKMAPTLKACWSTSSTTTGRLCYVTTSWRSLSHPSSRSVNKERQSLAGSFCEPQ